MGLYFDAPEAQHRDVGKETRETLQAQIDLAGDRAEAERTYGPEFSLAQAASTEASLFGDDSQEGLLGLYERAQPRLDEAVTASRSRDRMAEVSDVVNIAPEFFEATRAASPDAAAVVDRLLGDARVGLDDPGLTAFEDRSLRQGIRGAQSDRGFGEGANDAAIESMAVLRGNENRRTRRIGEAINALNAHNSLYGDPFMAITGRASGSGQVNQGLLQQGQFGAMNNSPQNFTFGDPFANDVFSSNFNAAHAARNSARNANAAMVGATIGAVGSLGGGLLGNEGLFS